MNELASQWGPKTGPELACCQLTSQIKMNNGVNKKKKKKKFVWVSSKINNFLKQITLFIRKG